MRYLRPHCALALSAVLWTSVPSFAQSGAEQRRFDELWVAANEGDLFVTVFVREDEQPSGSTVTAALITYNAATNEYLGCEGDDAVLIINRGAPTLSFITRASAWCAGGYQIKASCITTPESESLHSTTIGVLDRNGLRLNAHGLYDSYTNLACTLDVIGESFAGQGSAVSTLDTLTP